MALAFVFPGQGSQFVGMGAENARLRPVFKSTFLEADRLLGAAISALCWHGPEDALNDTYNTQPAIFTHSIAAWRMVELSGEIASPVCMAGHSLGELSALCAAGALTFEDGVRLARERGRLMREAGEAQPGSMAAVIGMDGDALHQVCAEVSAQHTPGVVVANDNAPGQIVISGGKQAVAAACELAKARGAKRAIPLNVSIASHSPLMQSAQAAFSRVVADTPIQPARVPVIANTSAQPITHPDDIRAELTAQLISPVRWVESVQRMWDELGVRQFIELGPKDVLCGLIRRIAPGAETHAIG